MSNLNKVIISIIVVLVIFVAAIYFSRIYTMSQIYTNKTTTINYTNKTTTINNSKSINYINLPNYNGCTGTSNTTFQCHNASYYNQSEYYNSEPTLYIEVKQNTGVSWASANFVFVPEGSELGNNNIPTISFNSLPANTYYSDIKIKSGENIPLWMMVNGTQPLPITIPANKSVAGWIWVAYSTTQNGPISYAEIAAVNFSHTNSIIISSTSIPN
jgi:hypothetical protein